MVCKNCGFENEAEALFCVSCGASLSDTENDYQSFDEDGFQQDVEQPLYYGMEMTEPKPEIKKVFGILAVVFGSIGVAFDVGTCCCSVANFIPYVGWMIPIAVEVLAVGFSIAGLVLGAIGVAKAKKIGVKDTLSIVGLVLSIVSLVIVIVKYVLAFLVAGGVTGLLVGLPCVGVFFEYFIDLVEDSLYYIF